MDGIQPITTQPTLPTSPPAYEEVVTRMDIPPPQYEASIGRTVTDLEASIQETTEEERKKREDSCCTGADDGECFGDLISCCLECLCGCETGDSGNDADCCTGCCDGCGD